MNVYPKDLEPTVTPPDSMGARGEREASYFATALWGPEGKCPARQLVRKPRRGEPCRAILDPITPPEIFDRELGRVVVDRGSVGRIGNWKRRPRPVTS